MIQSTETFLDKTLANLQQEGLKRSLRQLSGKQGPKITLEGREVLNFCSNNYLGLAGDERVGQAAIDCVLKEGFGSGASRLVCGNMNAHQELEKSIAEFKGAENCLLFSTGYMANVGIISSLFGRDDIIFSDRLNHASIIDGVQLSQAKWKRYPHRDMSVLEEMLKGSRRYRQRCIITDSVFSMDGDYAPLDAIVALAKRHDCLVMIDEAHALGVMGEQGKGLAEYFGVEEEIDVQMGTLSKAVGTFGAYCCGSNRLISYLINKARSFIYTTGLPPSTAAASLKAIEIIKSEPQRRLKLWENTQRACKELNQMGFDTMNSQTPIIPILVKDSNLAVDFSDRLFKQGIFVSAIRYPTVPENTARLRLTVMATHTEEHMDHVLEQFDRIGKELCLI
jgi:8-amino-7-oxononanoate synthase